MAKSSHHPKRRGLDPIAFSITSPQRGQTTTLATAEDDITVQISGEAGDNYQATIFAFTPGVGVGDQLNDTVALVQDSTTPTCYSATMDPIGSDIDMSVPGNNRIVKIDDLTTGDSESYAFRLEVAGSGVGTLAALRVNFCRPGQLVPVALTLQLDSKLTKGTCAKCGELNRPTLLLHSDDAKLAKCWLSQPIAFCGKSAPPGYWVLEKNSATAWTLVLKQGDKVLVTFTAKTKPKDCSLPITLQRKGAGNKVCKGWPKTVSIASAK